MKKIIFISILLLLTSCGSNNNIKNELKNNNSIKEKVKKNNEIKKYSYEELKDVFAISGNLCKGDILYKGERLKDTKDYSDYYFGMFTPTEEEQKKYNELTKIKIYGNENPLEFLAKYDMYCLGDFFDGTDIFKENSLKDSYLQNYYNKNKEAKNILNILKDSKSINLDKLKKVFTFSHKVPTFYEEIRQIDKNITLKNIYNNINTTDEKLFSSKILDNITKDTKSTSVFEEIINLYKKNNLLELKKEKLIKDLEYKKNNEGFLEFDFENILKILNMRIKNNGKLFIEKII